MGDETLIRAEHVSKKYCHSLRRSLLYGTKDIFFEIYGRNPSQESLRKDEFWAVREVSFELRRGECLGLIGPNGSGKSTLLKLLNGIVLPDIGKITLKGRISSLIELGAWFHPTLTGRENIFLSGTILGISRETIRHRFDDIVAFSELEDFIDTPVMHYSSGMLVRLGFSVSVYLEPDVLLLDEVLAVGDIGFRAKCLNTIGRMASESAVVLVSHNMPQVARLANHAMVLNRGEIYYESKDVSLAISKFYALFENQGGVTTGSGRAVIHSIVCFGSDGIPTEEIEILDDLTIQIEATVDPEIDNPILFVGMLDQELQIAAQCSSLWSEKPIVNQGGVIQATLRMKKNVFNPGTYYLLVTFTDSTQRELLVQDYATKNIKIKGKHIGFAPIQFHPDWSIESRSPVNNGIATGADKKDAGLSHKAYEEKESKS